MLFCATRYANKVNVRGAHCKQHKCYVVREILATIVKHAIGKRTQANVNITVLTGTQFYLP